MKKTHNTIIKLLILDVDGVLTDGFIIKDNKNNELKNFNVKDGLGIKLLLHYKIDVAIITGKKSQIVEQRFTELGLTDICQGKTNKLKTYFSLLKKYKLDSSQVAYMGDDLPDLPLLRKVGLSGAPNDALGYIKNNVDFISQYNSGRGAVRELCDLILDNQVGLDNIINDYVVHGEAQ